MALDDLLFESLGHAALRSNESVVDFVFSRCNLHNARLRRPGDLAACGIY